MRTYTLKKIHGAPDWNTIEVMPIDNYLWCDPVDITAQCQLCWDSDALYVRLEAKEKDIRMEETGPLAEVWDDSCLELFLQPVEGDLYMNFEITPRLSYLIGQGDTDVENRIRLFVPDFEERMDPKVTFTDTGWVLNYKIPFSFLRLFYPTFAAKEGVAFRANSFKCGDKTVTPHFMSWNCVASEIPNFHRPEFFGQLVLGGE